MKNFSSKILCFTLIVLMGIGMFISWFFKSSNIIIVKNREDYATMPSAINDFGLIVGRCMGKEKNSCWKTFLWKDGKRHVINEDNMYVYDVNSTGSIVGWKQINDTKNRAFFRKESGECIDLNVFGSDQCYAYSINDLEMVVGFSIGYYNEIKMQAFLWTEMDGIVSIGTLGGNDSRAIDINNRGEIVGEAKIENGEWRAFLWNKDQGMINLGTLGGSRSIAMAINEKGMVVGYSTTINGEQHAFLWTKEEGMIDLGTLGGNTSSARDVNDNGVIVGDSTAKNGDRYAFLWTKEDGMKKLSYLKAALSINNKGDFVGYRRYSVSSWTKKWNQIFSVLSFNKNFLSIEEHDYTEAVYVRGHPDTLRK